jgi:cytochrome c biogenesis protein CcmG, thiol:disulfide interchange protein DsbE
MLAHNILFAADAPQTDPSDMAPAFKLMDLNNKEFALSSLKGKPVILFFWTTWCPYCQKELRQMKDKQAELSKDAVELVAINVQEPAAKVKKFFENFSFPFKVLSDTEGDVSRLYEVMGVPTYFLIDKKGRVVFNNHYFPQKEYKGLVSK